MSQAYTSLKEMAVQLRSLTQLVKNQQEKISQLETELAEQRQQLQVLFNPTANLGASLERTSRRTMLRRLAGGLVAGIGLSTMADNAAPVQAKVVINPTGSGNSVIGSIILPSTTTYINQPPQGNDKFGIITSADPGTLDLSTLPNTDVGVYANSAGTAVYAVCNNRQGTAVQGSNTGTNPTGNGYGVYGVSQNGVGVGGTSMTDGAAVAGNSNTGPGVYGYSISGSGVLAQSGNGVPLTIRAGNTPTNGTRAFGDLYVDSTGKIYAWAKNDAGTISNWRQLAFAT